MVNTIFEPAKKLSSTILALTTKLSMWNGLSSLLATPKGHIQTKKKKQYNGFCEFISNIILACTTDLGETLKRFLEKHHMRSIFKLTFKPSTTYLQEKYRTRKQTRCL